MLFNSLRFGIFLPIVFVLYWIVPQKFRTFLILVVSYYFYMSWNVKYVFLIFFVTLVSYISGRLLEKEKREKQRGGIVAANTLICLALLFFFKYFNFFSDSLSGALQVFGIPWKGITLKVLLPVGISFYTFQTIAYVVDVSRENCRAEKNFIDYAAFVSFFPQLVAGPIERTENLLPQIKSEKKFDYDKATYGLKLMAWGFYKKLVIADVLSPYVERTFSELQAHRGVDYLIAMIFFAIQIYCDFSGYSDIAIGTAKLFGIDLMKNFESPYFATSITRLWGRWHISLSSWFHDYLYLPIVYSKALEKCSIKVRHSISMVITFLASGLWHGANWTFVVWGGLQGIVQVLEKPLEKPMKKFRKKRAGKLLLPVYTFMMYAIMLVFFRVRQLPDALYFFGHIFDGITSKDYWINTIALWPLPFAVILFSILVLAVYDAIAQKTDVIRLISTKKWYVRYLFYIGLLMFIMLFKASGEAEFVYFQF